MINVNKVIENYQAKMLWDFQIHTDKVVVGIPLGIVAEAKTGKEGSSGRCRIPK